MRHDRLITLDELTAYPGSDFLDMVWFFPPTEGKSFRLWLLTEAEQPRVRIDDLALESQGEKPGPPRWLDLGVTAEVTGGFGQLRIQGMSISEAHTSALLITQNLDFEPGGDLQQVERQLWGLSRREAGSTTLQPARVTVGEPTRFRLVYTAGPVELPPGARIRFALHKYFSAPQIQDPQAPGWLEISCEQAPLVVESVGRSDESHEKTDLISRLPEGLSPGAQITVSYATEEMYIYPHYAWETDPRYWYVFLPPLAVGVAVDERNCWVSLLPEHSHTFEVAAGPATRLHLFLPGRLKAGTPMPLRGLFTDRFRNLPAVLGLPTNIRLVLETPAGTLELGTPAEHFTAAHHFSLPLPPLEPGVYRVRAYDADTGDLQAASNPLEVLPTDSEEPNLYWGEIHGHTEQSDATGGFDELFRHAREEGYLDFAAAADHACYFSDNQWLWMQDVVNANNRPGEFVTLVGYEWAGRQSHRNIYTSGNRLELFRGMYAPTSSLDAVYPHLSGREDLVAGPHHPVPEEGWTKYHDPTIERFVEIYSMWGARDRPDSPLVGVEGGPDRFFVHDLLNQGAVLGFTGGGDCHQGKVGFTCEDPDRQGQVGHSYGCIRYRCGMTAALLPQLTREALIAALRNRQTYATTGARILLSFSVSGVAMGGLGPAEQAQVTAHVHGCTALDHLEIVRDGEVCHRQEESGLDAVVDWTDPEPITRRRWYYLHLVQQDGQEAWSSPVWLEPPLA